MNRRMSSLPGPHGSHWLGKNSGGAGVRAFSLWNHRSSGLCYAYISAPCDNSLVVVRLELDVVVHVGVLAVDPCAQSGFASGHEASLFSSSCSMVNLLFGCCPLRCSWKHCNSFCPCGQMKNVSST